MWTDRWRGWDVGCCVHGCMRAESEATAGALLARSPHPRCGVVAALSVWIAWRSGPYGVEFWCGDAANGEGSSEH